MALKFKGVWILKMCFSSWTVKINYTKINTMGRRRDRRNERREGRKEEGGGTRKELREEKKGGREGVKEEERKRTWDSSEVPDVLVFILFKWLKLGKDKD